MINLEFNAKNFINDLMFHPEHGKTKDDQNKALATTIFIGLITLGVAHACVGLYHLGSYIWHQCIKQKEQENLKTVDLLTQAIARDQNLIQEDQAISLIQEDQKKEIKSKTSSPSIHLPTSSLKNSAVQQIAAKKREKTSRIGSMYVTSESMVGPVGDRTTWKTYPEYLDHLTLEDGSPLPFHTEDFFIEFEVFDLSRSLKKIDFPGILKLPAALFQEKKEGDTLRLKYKGHLIELTLKQNTPQSRGAQRLFEEILELATFCFKQFEIGKPSIYAPYNHYWWYQIGKNGAFYRLQPSNEKEISLIQEDPTKLRSLKKPLETQGVVRKEDSALVFKVDFPRSQIQDIDILVNERHIIFYSQFDSRDVHFPDGYIHSLPGKEFYYTCQWNLWSIDDLSLSKVKLALSNGRASITDTGLFTLTIPYENLSKST